MLRLVIAVVVVLAGLSLSWTDGIAEDILNIARFYECYRKVSFC